MCYFISRSFLDGEGWVSILGRICIGIDIGRVYVVLNVSFLWTGICVCFIYICFFSFYSSIWYIIGISI